MAEYKWPEGGKRSLIGKRIKRLDGPDKVSGRAKYTFDLNRPGMLFGKVLRSPHAHAKIVSIDLSVAEKMPGVKAVKIIQEPGTEIQWVGDEIAVVAAETEGQAEDAMRAIKVQYEKLPHFVSEQSWDAIPEANRRKPSENVTGDPAKALKEADVVLEGTYGNEVITHCCLESHGLIAEWEDDKNLLVHQSTQSVSANGAEFARALQLPAGNVRIKMEHIGGGFGSKFPVDRWGIEAAKLSKMAGGKPIKLMLERDSELMVAGSRPSIFAKIKVGAKKDGTIVGWESEAWGSGGVGNFGFRRGAYERPAESGFGCTRIHHHEHFDFIARAHFIEVLRIRVRMPGLELIVFGHDGEGFLKFWYARQFGVVDDAHFTAALGIDGNLDIEARLNLLEVVSEFGETRENLLHLFVALVFNRVGLVL